MKIGLFIPCYIDQLYPQVGRATLSLLMRLGLWVFGQIVFTRQRKLGTAK